jgi:pectin methylesterase-like acyl-CoA thioesterase
MIIGITLLFLFLISKTTISFENSYIDILYVDDDGDADYTNIQDAIDYSNQGDIIFVYSGFYHENLNINKEICLMGEDNKNTIIDSDIYNDTISINANNVKISGFKIQHGYIGIKLAGVGHSDISNNIIYDNIVGIGISFNSHYNEVYSNEIIGNKNMGVSVHYVEKDNYNSFSSNNFIDNGKNARPEAVKCEWSNNFWDNWIGNKMNAFDFLPYLVHFYLLNFDWNPATEPYEI